MCTAPADTPLFLIPLIPFKTNDLSFLFSDWNAKALIRHTLDKLRGEAASGVHLVTTDADIAAALSAAPVTLHLVQTDAGFADYPATVRFAVRHCLDAGVFGPKRHLVVIHPFYPFLAPETWQACRQALAKDPEARLASFGESSDHPPQQFLALDYGDMDMFVFPDHSRAARALGRACAIGPTAGLSHPFFFDWREHGVWQQDTGLYCLETTDRRHAVVPRAITAAQIQSAATQLLYIRDSPWSARRLLDDRADTRARPCFAVHNPLRLTARRQGQTLHLAWPIAPGRREFFLRLWPMLARGPGKPVDCAPAANGRDVVEGAALLPRGARGFVAARLEVDQDGHPDCRERVSAPGLWLLDPKTGNPVHPASGKPLRNRQDFPELFVRDQVIQAGRAQGLLDAGEPEEGWTAIRLTALERIKVENRLDALRAQALLAAPGMPVTTADLPRDTAAAVVADQGPPPVRNRPGLFQPAWKPARRHTPAPQATDDDAGAEAARSLLVPPRFLAPAAVEGANRSAALDARLAWRLWRYERMRDSFHAPWRRPRDLGLLQGFLDNRIGHGQGLRHRLWSIVAQPRLDGAARSGDRPGSRAPVPLVAQGGWASAQAIRKVATDGVDALFTNPTETPGLYVHDLQTKTSKNIAVNEAAYCGIWFDDTQQLLYAIFRKDRQGLRRGIDIFRKNGKHLGRYYLNPNKFYDINYLSEIKGNKKSLLLLDWKCWIIYEIDKHTFEILSAHDFSEKNGLYDIHCHDNEIYYCRMQHGEIGRYHLDGTFNYVVNSQTLFPMRIRYDRVEDKIYVLSCTEMKPTHAPTAYSIKIFDRDFTFLGEYDIGRMGLGHLCLLNDSRRLVVTDYRGHIQCYDLTHAGSAPRAGRARR